jgi:RNAse (barnase) inhibitor barstar
VIDNPVTRRWLLIEEPAAEVAACADIDGLFVDGSGRAPATLIGCRSSLPIGRRVNATIHNAADDGTATHVVGTYLRASVTGTRPSALGDGLVDVVFDGPISDPMPAGAREIWELWQGGRPAELGLWARYDSRLRHEWSGAALAHHPRIVPDGTPGVVYHLDGRDVTDLEGFFCAIGEAINGPGGYFGWNADALHDCVTGGWGAWWPFRLVWDDSDVARAHLAAPFGRGPAPQAGIFDSILRWLAEDDVEVELR